MSIIILLIAIDTPQNVYQNNKLKAPKQMCSNIIATSIFYNLKVAPLVFLSNHKVTMQSFLSLVKVAKKSLAYMWLFRVADNIKLNMGYCLLAIA